MAGGGSGEQHPAHNRGPEKIERRCRVIESKRDKEKEKKCNHRKTMRYIMEKRQRRRVIVMGRGPE